MSAAELASTRATPPLFLTPQEVVAIAGLDREQLQKLRSTGAGPAYFTIGAAVRYRPADVEAWMRDRAENDR